MDKQARLNSIMQSINENSQKEAQALYGAELSLKTKEYEHLKLCVDKLIAIRLLNEDLSIEAKSLQESIEEESKEVILWVTKKTRKNHR